MRKTHKKSIFDRNKQSLKGLLNVAGVTDNKDLSKRKSGMPCRYPLAFFVLKNRVASQVTDHNSTTHLPPFLGVNRHILGQPQFEEVKFCGWVTLLNNPFWRIGRAVAFTTESEPSHPMIFHSVVLTQNVKGGHNYAC